jgi:REP element-mobilizing transposase RayT
VPLHSHLPHLRAFENQPIVFLTVVTHLRQPCLANAIAFGEITDVLTRSSEIDGWFVGDYLLMPDHAHLFARPSRDAKPLRSWMGTWKSISSRKISAALATKRSLWQRDYFDRFLRTTDDYSEKWNYVAMNPVRAGLCTQPDEWPWKGRLFDLKF